MAVALEPQPPETVLNPLVAVVEASIIDRFRTAPERAETALTLRGSSFPRKDDAGASKALSETMAAITT